MSPFALGNVCTDVDEKDDDDLTDTAQIALKNAPPEMKAFIKGQLTNISLSPNGRRWDLAYINLCLGLYMKSPGNYEHLKQFDQILK